MILAMPSGAVPRRLYSKDTRKKGPCMRTLLSCCLALLLITGTVTFAAAPEITTDEQKTLYTLGLALSRSLGGFTLSEAELEIVKLGLTDGVLQREPKADPQLFMPKVQEMQKTRTAAVAAVEHKAGEDFLAKAAAAPGAKKTASGLVMTTLTPGTGASPTADDTVRVHYHGTLIDGTVFDSSVQRGEPATFPLKGLSSAGQKESSTCKLAVRAAWSVRPNSPMASAVRRRASSQALLSSLKWSCSTS